LKQAETHEIQSLGGLVGRRFPSGERVQASAKFLGGSIRNKPLDLFVSALPNWNRTRKQIASLCSEFQHVAPSIGRVWKYLYQPATFQRLQCSG